MLQRPAVVKFAAILLSLIPLSAFGQAVYKQVKPANPAQVREDLQRVEEDPRFATERDRMDEQMNRRLLDMRRNMMQDALNRMDYARYNGPRFEVQRLITDCMIFSVFVIILCALLWLIRTIFENRRWSRVAAIQTDVHTKLLEKMSSSQELLAYMETEAGKRFLESSPFEIEHHARPSLPFGRILLPAQAGVVILMAGAAMIWLQDRLPDSAQPLLIFGSLGMALGIGLVFSAALAYSLSKHMGLDKPQ